MNKLVWSGLFLFISQSLFAQCVLDVASSYNLNRFPERKIELLVEQMRAHQIPISLAEPDHFSDIGIESGSNARAYLMNAWKRLETGLASGQMFGRTLSAKELTSLQHQKDLLDAVVANNGLFKKLNAAGFDLEAYLRGTIDSDMGKLSAYDELWTKASRKSTLLLNVMQGRGPRKSQRVVNEVLAESGYPQGMNSFINPKLSHIEIRETFEEIGAYRGYYHEFPGMVDAVTAHEMGRLSSAEFKAQLKANLFHNGPDEGFWKMLGHIFIPGAAGNSSKPRLFENTIFHSADNPTHLTYGRPASFEAFIAVFFDRMSQGSKGGYLKIDYELIFMDPLDNVRNLVLEDSIDWTIDQLSLLRKIALESADLTEQQRQLTVDLIERGSARLSNYRENMKNIISMPRSDDGKVIKPVREMTIRGRKNEASQGHYKISLVSEQPNRYELSDLEDGGKRELSEPEAREFIREQLKRAMDKEERMFGDPMRSSYDATSMPFLL